MMLTCESCGVETEKIHLDTKTPAGKFAEYVCGKCLRKPHCPRCRRRVSSLTLVVGSNELICRRCDAPLKGGVLDGAR